jgi:CDP-diacylglycerol--glycerol-3-phosphate 3-phosphatidyltransferase
MKSKSLKADEFTYNPVKRLNTAVVKTLDKKKFPSTILIIVSFLLYITAAVIFAISNIRLAAVFLLLGGVFGLINNQLQSRRGSSVPADFFLVSALERYSDIFIFIGLIYRYIRLDELLVSLVAILSLVGCILVSYTGLRKELTDTKITLGFMRRAERIAIIIIGAFLGHMITALYIIAILSNLDALSRIFYIYKVLKSKDA